MKIQNQIKKCSYLKLFLILTIIITIPIILFNSNLEAQVIDAQVDIEPDTLNLSSTGIWITAYIVLPEGYNVEDIDVESIRLDDTIATEMSDIQDNILMVKFNRQEVINLIKLKGISGEDPLDVELKINGYLNDGVSFFEGTDIIRFLWSYVCITIPYPLHGTTINELQPELMATYFPGKFEIDFDSFYSIFNEADISTLYSVYSDKATYQVDTELPTGQNNLEVSITDIKGNTDIAQSIFNVSPANNPPVYYFSIIGQKSIFTSPADGTYSKYNISSGVDISMLNIQSFHSALDGSGFYFSLLDEEGIYYTPGDGSFVLFLSSHDLGVPGQYIDALHIGFNNNTVYFSTIGSGDILQSSGDGSNTLFKSADALGISGMDLNSLYIATDGKIYFSIIGDGRILQSSGDGTNTVFFNPSTLGVPGYKLNAFSVIPDDTQPDIQIDEPSDGSTVNSSKPNIVVSFEDKGMGINASGLDLTTFTASINGEDYSSYFTVTQTGATYQPLSDLPGGANTVTVGISDMAGNTASATSNFTVAALRAIPGATPTSGTAPLTVHFTTQGEDPSGTIEVYRWDFNGNGSWDTYDTVALDYNHTYNNSGTYTAILYVESSTGQTATASVTITVYNNPPTATADVVPSNGAVPLTVQLIGSGSDIDGDIDLYEWDYEGDGTFDWSSDTSGNTSYTYTTEGTYNAVFRVTDNQGATSTAVAITTVISAGPPGSPTAQGSASPQSGPAPLTVSFNGTGTDTDGTIVLYEWDFDGDGVYDWSSSTSAATSYIYNNAGTFTPAFRVTDNDGLAGIDHLLIEVGLQVDLSIADPDFTFNPSAGESIGISASINAPVPASVLIKDQDGGIVKTIPVDTTNIPPPVFYDTIEGGPDGWSANGLWHIVNMNSSPYPEAHSGVQSWWYGLDNNGTYNTGSTNSGRLISPPITISEQDCELTFWSWEQTECGNTDCFYDSRIVYISTNDGVSWIQAAKLISGESSWYKVNLSLATYYNQTIRLKFEFNTYDSILNNYRGWYIDDVKIISNPDNVIWDGKDNNNFPVKDGPYYAILRYQHQGTWHEYDLTNTTGGGRFIPPRQSTGGSENNPALSRPFEDQFLPVNFTLDQAAEVTLFVGVLWTTDTRIRTILNRVSFPAGNHTVYWDGLDDNENIARAPLGDNLILGIWGYYLPDNAIFVTGGKPIISSIAAEPNYFSPFSEKCDSLGNGEGIVISYTLSEDVTLVKLRVFSLETGSLIKSDTKTNINAGVNTFFWDGKNNNDEYADIGDYQVGIIATDTDGNESMWRYTLVRFDY